MKKVLLEPIGVLVEFTGEDGASNTLVEMYLRQIAALKAARKAVKTKAKKRAARRRIIITIARWP